MLVLSSVRRTLEPESARGLRLAELAKQFDAEQVAADARSLAEGVSLIHFATIKVFKSDSEGADPPRFSPEPEHRDIDDGAIRMRMFSWPVITGISAVPADLLSC